MAKKRSSKRNLSPLEIWDTSKSPVKMFHTAKDHLTPRRQRLFAIACCKSLWGPTGTYPGYLEVLELAEAMADNPAPERMSELLALAEPFRQLGFPHGVIHLLSENAEQAAHAWTHMLGLTPGQTKRHADILREVMANPFANLQLDGALLAWRDGTIPKLAQACYESNDLSMIGILGDALEEAGCNDLRVFEHVRKKQAHFRGCWLVDWILARK